MPVTNAHEKSKLLPGDITTNYCYILMYGSKLVRLQIIYNPQALRVAPSLSSGATAQGLRVINFVDPYVLKLTIIWMFCYLEPSDKTWGTLKTVPLLSVNVSV